MHHFDRPENPYLHRGERTQTCERRQPVFIRSLSRRLSSRCRTAMAIADTANQASTRAKESPMHRHPKRPLDSLAQLAPFVSCTRRELAVADSLMTTVVTEADRVLVREGDVGMQCFLVREGTVAVSCDGLVIGIAGPG